jgi:hypothetical protein
MRRPPLCLALFAFGLTAFCRGPAAWADGDAPPPAPGGEAMPAKARDYQRWHYKEKGMPGWSKAGAPKKKHTELHGEGKAANRTHVHPKFWNTKWVRESEMLFTITDVRDKPEDMPTEGPVTFCLYHCESRWTYVDSNTDYQTLYEDMRNGMLDFLPCSDPCGVRVATYFTVCAKDEGLYSGRKCCEELGRVFVPSPIPACAPPEQRHRCLLGGWLRSRRGCGPCRSPRRSRRGPATGASSR